MTRPEETTETGSKQSLWWLALTIGVAGAVFDSVVNDLGLIAAPQIAAVVVGSRLPKKQLVILVTVLSLLVILPAIAHLPDGSFPQRLIGVALLLMVARFVDRLAKAATSDGSESESIATPQKAQILQSLAETGSFDQSQLTIVRSHLSIIEKIDDCAEEAPTLSTGSHIGRYIIDEQLGRGGSSYVYAGRDPDTGEDLAVKILYDVQLSDQFRREMQVVQQLAHPNIVTAYEVGDFQGLPFIAMELLPGPDLNRHVSTNGPINWRTAATYVLQTARALAHAHDRDLIHRDIKPGNIMLTSEGQVKLVDLGLAVEAIRPQPDSEDSMDETIDTHIAGTLAYMAPEQARPLGVTTNQSDIYGLGATWHFLLTGESRLLGTSVSKQFLNLLTRKRFRALPDDIMPERLFNIYMKMVEYEPKKRFENCATLVAELESALTAEGESVESEDIHVLIVEDSRADMLRTINVLRQTNKSLEIHQATTLCEGLDSYKELQIDLVLLDLTLPDSAGVDTVARFRQDACEVPIVVLTGASADTISDACIEAGATSFMSKVELSAHKMERTIFVTLSRNSPDRQRELMPKD